MIDAIHILSTAPLRNGGRAYRMEPYEASSMALSALLWQRHNGRIKLYTDTEGLNELVRLGIDRIYDGGIDVSVIPSIPAFIDQNIYWAAAKVFALQNETAPIAMIDTDLMVWKSVSEAIDGNCLVCLHPESVSLPCYLPKEKLNTPQGYIFPASWDWKIPALNTAFAFFDDTDFKDTYCHESIRFMTENAPLSSDRVAQMVFAEQRLLAMCAKANGIKTATLLDDPFQKDNDIVTHLWGSKRIARSSKEQQEILNNALLAKIRQLDANIYERLRDSLSKLK